MCACNKAYFDEILNFSLLLLVIMTKHFWGMQTTKVHLRASSTCLGAPTYNCEQSSLIICAGKSRLKPGVLFCVVWCSFWFNILGNQVTIPCAQCPTEEIFEIKQCHAKDYFLRCLSEWNCLMIIQFEDFVNLWTSVQKIQRNCDLSSIGSICSNHQNLPGVEPMTCTMADRL